METKKIDRFNFDKRQLGKAIEKEEFLRIKWLMTYQERLQEQFENEKLVSKEDYDKIKKDMINSYRKSERKGKYFVEAPLDTSESITIKDTMKPSTQQHLDLLYKDTQREGRIRYLRERVKILPENKYYEPQTTSFDYGWKMWNYNKDNPQQRRGRQQIIKHSFYRPRAGIERDPDWYKQPAKLSPDSCGCI